jgi:hypothetical protein
MRNEFHQFTHDDYEAARIARVVRAESDRDLAEARVAALEANAANAAKMVDDAFHKITADMLDTLKGDLERLRDFMDRLTAGTYRNDAGEVVMPEDLFREMMTL